MFTLELSSHVLEIRKDAPSKPYWLINTQSRVLQADMLILKNVEQAALSITIPIQPDLETTSTLTTFRTHLYYSHTCC